MWIDFESFPAHRHVATLPLKLFRKFSKKNLCYRSLCTLSVSPSMKSIHLNGNILLIIYQNNTLTTDIHYTYAYLV